MPENAHELCLVNAGVDVLHRDDRSCGRGKCLGQACDFEGDRRRHSLVIFYRRQGDQEIAVRPTSPIGCGSSGGRRGRRTDAVSDSTTWARECMASWSCTSCARVLGLGMATVTGRPSVACGPCVIGTMRSESK